MDENKDKYLEAARLVANCKPNKLPYVLALLKQGGFEISQETIDEAKQKVDGRNRYRQDLRDEHGTDGWKDTDDPACLTLRKLYENGESIIRLSRASGIHKTTLYSYIRGTAKPSKPTINRINEALSSLYGDKYT